MHPVVRPVGRPPAQDPHGVARLRAAQAHSNLSAAGSAVVGTCGCPLSIPVPLEPLVPASNCRGSGAPSASCVRPPAPPSRQAAGRMGGGTAGPGPPASAALPNRGLRSSAILPPNTIPTQRIPMVSIGFRLTPSAIAGSDRRQTACAAGSHFPLSSIVVAVPAAVRRQPRRGGFPMTARA